jgi:hypothetical protein
MEFVAKEGTTSVSAEDINKIAAQINDCATEWYKKFYNKDFNSGEFKGCCDTNEIKLIQDCIEIYLTNNPTANKQDVTRAIVSYYYELQVLESYVADDADSDYTDKFNCLKGFYNAETQKIVYQLVTSNDIWASEIRRKILNMNIGGKKIRRNKQRRKSQKRKASRGKSQKRKSSRRKTKIKRKRN